MIGTVLRSKNKREVAVAGVARVRVSRSCFLEKFRDIEAFRKSPAVHQIGKQSAEVSTQDVESMTLDVVSVTDVTIYELADRVWIASKQVLLHTVLETAPHHAANQARKRTAQQIDSGPVRVDQIGVLLWLLLRNALT